MEKKINHSLNALKVFAILAVIIMHCIQINQMSKSFPITVGLMKFAVPIFFLISGFYSFYDDIQIANNKYKTRIIRLLKLIIFANLFYFIVTPDLHNLMSLNSIFNIKAILACLIVNLPLISGHLWFLDALLYCYILVFILSKLKINLNKFYFMIPLLLVTNIILGEISNGLGIQIMYYWYRNFIFTGLPFFMIGYLIHDKLDIITEKFSNKSLLIYLLISCCLIISETFFAETDLYIGTIFFSIIVFIICILNPNKINYKLSELIGGKLYGYIYILHLYVIQTLLVYYSLNLGYLNPIMVFIVTTFISYIVYLLVNKIKMLNFSFEKFSS